MNIVFFDDLEQDIVSINFVVPIGTKTIYKGKKNNFAHLVEHLLFHGHPELTQYELMLQIEQMGGLVNAGINSYYTELYARVHKKYVIETINLLSRAINCFSIRREEYESEKKIIAVEEKMQLTNENALLDVVLDEFFEKFPKSAIPSFNNIKKLYKEIYDNWTIIIIGKLCENEKKMISSIFTADINSNVDPLN
ncbi:MAG: insulinase family protein, partial [Dysgonamonadaceae bacterium]|nr:insulinase family protein [Dysgonamonadaceae bacterium]